VSHSKLEADVLERSILDSAGGRVASSWAGRLRRAWASSAVRRLWMRAADEWTLLTLSARIRTVAVAIAAAMLADRAMLWLSPRPADPLSALLPLGVLAASVVAAASSDALARGCERLRR
jgi:hypothetical protein